MSDIPSPTNGGLTFFPVPKFDMITVAFGAEEKDFFQDRNDLPQVPQKYIDQANKLFFQGGAMPDLDPRVNRIEAGKAVQAWLSSFAPSHEQKEATVGYAFWVWSTTESIDMAIPEQG